MSVLLLPILAHSLADIIGGNAFVAAFIAGSAFAGALSVLAHGLSADPLASGYGRWVNRTHPTAETAGSREPRTRKAVLARGA